MKRAVIVMVVATLFVGVSFGVPQTFFGEDASAGGSLPVPNSDAAQAAFLASLTGVRVEDFEGFAVGTTFPFDVHFGSDTATLNGTSMISSTGVQGSPMAGRFAISGEQYLNVGSTDARSFTLSFSAPQAAFGFYATDIGDWAGQLTVSLDGSVLTVPHTVNAPDGSGLFFGVIDTANPFTTVAFGNTSGALEDAFGFDDFTIGRRENVVPDGGATILLLAAGLLGSLGLRRRIS